MSIITISKGSFSRGVDIAERVAEKLGYRCVAREVLIEASKEFNIPEVKLIQAIEDPPSFFDRFTDDKKQYIEYIHSALLDLFRADNIVYHGLAGHIFVQDIPHVIKVRIISDLAYRIRFVMIRDKTSRDKAMDFLKKIDRSRKKWGNHLYGLNIEDPVHYDIVINTEKVSLESAVHIICEMTTWKQFQATPESQIKLDYIAGSLKALAIDAAKKTREDEYWRHL